MGSSVATLYEPLISRDLDNIAPAIHDFLSTGSPAELRIALIRFAILAYAPTEQGRHAIFSIVAADAAIESFPDRLEEIFGTCARYSASSRLPWSEPPIPDPPRIDPRSSMRESLRLAIAAGDRLGAERWLAGNLATPDFRDTFFSAASDDLSDFGHNLTVGVHAWKIAASVPPEHRFAILRIAAWEWAACRSEAPEISSARTSMELGEAVRICLRNMADRAEGAVDAHWLELLDAAVEASGITESNAILERVLAHLSTRLARSPEESPSHARVETLPPPVYDLSRDYGCYLRSFAIAPRLERAVPGLDRQEMMEASYAALTSGLSFEETL